MTNRSSVPEPGPSDVWLEGLPATQLGMQNGQPQPPQTEEWWQEMEAHGLARPGLGGQWSLTPKGVEWLQALKPLPSPRREVPRYLADQRILEWRGRRGRRFERRAPNQMAILLAFERQQTPWPSCIDNPFGTDKEAHVRANQTLKDLNRRLKRLGLHFHLTLEGRICWTSEEERKCNST